MEDRNKDITEIVKAIRPNECPHFPNGDLDCAKCPMADISEKHRCYYYFEAEKVYDYIVKCKKEVATEILEAVGNLADECDERFHLRDLQWHKDMCKKFGVENEQKGDKKNEE